MIRCHSLAETHSHPSRHLQCNTTDFQLFAFHLVSTVCPLWSVNQVEVQFLSTNMVNITTTYEGSVHKIWPRRLLDTISMTSFERQDGNSYGGEHEPTYSILSYTWGRFALKPAPPGAARLAVEGITWEIPAIDPSYFTAAQFHQAINSTREMSGNRYLWLDVACIDQEDYAVKMEEVGRQAGIFANAGMTFVWLWTVPRDTLQTSSRRVSAVNRDWSWQESETELARLKESVCTFLDDWWFSSLWTLQEEGLRSDARILPRGAETTLPHTYLSVLALGFRVTLAHIGETTWRSSLESPQMQADAEELELRIRRAGYLTVGGTNPNQRFTQARWRKTKKELDRVYGVMALYNIQVGAAVPGADASRPYTLGELEDEFAMALNVKSALLGQLFVHCEKPKSKSTWQITQHGRVPDEFLDWGTDFVSFDDFIIDARSGGPARLRASISSLDSLAVFWKARFEELDDYLKRNQVVVVVDDYVRQEHTSFPSSDPYDDLMVTRETFYRTAKTVDTLLETFGASRLSAARLGARERSRRGSPGQFSDIFGLLILHDATDRGRCKRIGLCRWEGKGTYYSPISADVEALRPRFEEVYHGYIY